MNKFNNDEIFINIKVMKSLSNIDNYSFIVIGPPKFVGISCKEIA